jgi:hypothetical protein
MTKLSHEELIVIGKAASALRFYAYIGDPHITPAAKLELIKIADDLKDIETKALTQDGETT